MKTLASSPALCSTCGRGLNGNGHCVACLVQIAFDETANETASLAFGDFEIAQREDGSPCELGHGAMGVTYRATDTVLHRKVALKVIDVSTAPGGAKAVRERFLREARAAAALRHPNVASVFHFGASPEIDRCYYAMELVEGETLEALVRREGPVAVETALEIGLQVTRALIAAGAQNLVHRDLKPANIMLTPNALGTDAFEVKVIDFGLAKIVSGNGDAMELTHGGFVGTPTFASPEQFAGKAADARSDIYSLGVTLWYALTGEVPCPGKTIDEIRQRQTDLPLPVSTLAARKVPKPVIALLSRALAVDPAQRPSSPRELLAGLEACRAKLLRPNEGRLRRWTAAAIFLGLFAAAFFIFRGQRTQIAPAPIPEKSIAVLPFENLSSDREDAYFADGLQEEVLTGLVKLKDLKVIGSSSVMAYRDKTKRDLRAIGRQLNVAYVLEASVRRVANRVLLHVSLIDARNHEQLWAERFDRNLADAVTLQSELATEVAAVLHAQIAPAERELLEAKATENPEAYLLYLRARAREAGADKDKPDAIGAEQLYAQAIGLDAKFALAYARASIVTSKISSDFGTVDNGKDPARIAKARAEAETAIRLAPNLGEGHYARALCYLTVDQNQAAAWQELTLAEQTAPNNAEIQRFFGAIYRLQRRWPEAIASYGRAQELEPRDADYTLAYGRMFLLVRDWPKAIAIFEHGCELEPTSGYAIQRLASAQFYSGDLAAAKRTLSKLPGGFEYGPWLLWDRMMIERDFSGAEKVLAQVPDAQERTYCQASTELARGDNASAHRLFEILRPSLEKEAREHPDDAGATANLGRLYAFLGRKEDAIRESRRAVELDPTMGASLACNLAMVYARTGEEDQALTLIEKLLRTPGAVRVRVKADFGITLAELRLRWEWDALRSNPRFQKILAAPEPKTILEPATR